LFPQAPYPPSPLSPRWGPLGGLIFPLRSLSLPQPQPLWLPLPSPHAGALPGPVSNELIRGRGRSSEKRPFRRRAQRQRPVPRAERGEPGEPRGASGPRRRLWWRLQRLGSRCTAVRVGSGTRASWRVQAGTPCVMARAGGHAESGVSAGATGNVVLARLLREPPLASSRRLAPRAVLGVGAVDARQDGRVTSSHRRRRRRRQRQRIASR